MKKLKRIIALLTVAVMFAGCSVTLPVTATGNEIGDKVGRSNAIGLAPTLGDGGIWFSGDASIKTAAQNAGISKISTVDQKTTVIFGITFYETIVTGE